MLRQDSQGCLNQHLHLFILDFFLVLLIDVHMSTLCVQVFREPGINF